jgi:hypothetical protein
MARRNCYIATLQILVLACSFLFSSCSSYNLGTAKKLDFKSIYIAPAANNSYAPQAQAIITKQVTQALIQENSIHVANAKDADATLSITLTNFDRRESSVQSLDTQRARAYDISLEATCTLTDNRNGKIYFKDRKVKGTINAFVDDGLQSVEYQNMPLLTKKIAMNIRDEIVSTW